MYKVMPGDLVYSYYGKKIQRIGVIESTGYAFEKPQDKNTVIQRFNRIL